MFSCFVSAWAVVLVEPSKSVRQPRVKAKREDSLGLDLKGYGSPWTFWSASELSEHSPLHALMQS